MGNLHMRIAGNLGDILLEIAQNNILEGNIEKAFSIYTDSLYGFTKEYAMMLLKNQAVLVVNEEEQTMDLKDDSELLQENADKILDWEYLIKDKINTLDNILDSRNVAQKEFYNYYKGDVENYNIYEMMHRYFNDEDLKSIGAHNIAAAILGSPDGKLHNHQYDNPQSKWDRIEDEVEGGDAPKWKNVLYWTVKYVKLIKILHEEYLRFEPMYNFLVENEFIKRIPFIEMKIENILYILKNFSDTSKGYYHPMCNTGLYDYKNKLLDDLVKTKYGNEYLKNGIIQKDIMDGYDAGWLSSEGEFYGANGETSAMIHMNIADQIFDAPTNKYAVQMARDNVDKFGGNDGPDYWLEKHGWIKIHHNDIYGSFIGHKGEEPTNDYPYAYCPTEIQIKMICDYADKFYGGKFYTEANAFGRNRHKDPFTTYAVRQMDEIRLHEIFGY